MLTHSDLLATGMLNDYADIIHQRLEARQIMTDDSLHFFEVGVFWNILRIVDKVGAE